MVKAGMPGRDLHLHVDGAGLDTLERHGRNALTPSCPPRGPTRLEHLQNIVGSARGRMWKSAFWAGNSDRTDPKLATGRIRRDLCGQLSGMASRPLIGFSASGP